MFKPKTKEFESRSENTYTFQTVLPSVWVKIEDKITDKHGRMIVSVAIPELLDKVVVQPSGLKLDDFESWSEANEVAAAAYSFQQANE